MKDTDLADEIIARLNRLIEDPEIRADVEKLLGARVTCSMATMGHPAIQGQALDPRAMIRVRHGAVAPAGLLGFLGILNGLVGVVPESQRGHITAVFEDGGGPLVRFERSAA